MNEKLPYLDASLPVADRVKDLMSRMTIEEKAAQVAAPFGTAVDVHQPPSTGWGCATASLSSLSVSPREAAAAGNELQRKHIEETRLGIPVLLAEEALVGLKVQGTTTFPDAIAQAATWDPDLIESMAKVIGIQMAHMGVRQALSPLADIARDPRWGRVEETYGEEPYLVGSMATAFVRGLQNAHEGTPLVAALKHFIGYGASDGGRNTDAAHIGPNELREVHATPFEMAIRVGGVKGIMPSYNSIDGVPVTGSQKMLGDLLHNELGFDGIIISDLEAVSQLHSKHGTAADIVHAFAQAIQAGVDLDLDNHVSTEVILDGVNQGILTEAELDRAVGSVLRTKFELGLFERPYVDVDAVPESLDSDSERALARTIAEKSTILLQNEPVDGAPILPLIDKPRTIAVIGPNADRPMGQLGNYSYQVLDSMTKKFALAANPQARMETSEDTGADSAELLVESVPLVSFLDGIRTRAGADTTILYAQGSPVAREDRSGFPEAVDAASAADVAIVVLGDQSGIGNYATVGEGIDSVDAALPGVQRELVEAVVASGTPTILVLSHGRAYVLGDLIGKVPAIISSLFAGEEAGTAVASVIFGDVNPAGRLPIALLKDVGVAPIPYWRTLQPATYVNGTTAAAFGFGHGLSYTTFEYRDLAIAAAEIGVDGTAKLSFTVVNTGERAGDEVVQVYGRDLVASTVRRGRVLVGFRRVHLEPGAAVRVSVQVPANMFAVWTADSGWAVEPGEVRFYIGGSSVNTPLQGTVNLAGDLLPLASADRALFSIVSAEPTEAGAWTTPDEVVDLRQIPEVTADSTIKEWLAHPVGGGLLRELMAGADEDALAPALGLSFTQMAYYSQGQITEDTVAAFVQRVRSAHAEAGESEDRG
ncbi:glycoside hydrolase family 3 N-terminal domain-containing protein [Microbacterium maritypicum]